MALVPAHPVMGHQARQLVDTVASLRKESPEISNSELYRALEQRLRVSLAGPWLPPLQALAVRDLPFMAPFLCFVHAKQAVDTMMTFQPYALSGYYSLGERHSALFVVVQSKGDANREGANPLDVYALCSSPEHLQRLDPGDGSPVQITLPRCYSAMGVRLCEAAAQPWSAYHAPAKVVKEEIQWDCDEMFIECAAFAGRSGRMVGADHPVFGSSLAEALAAATAPGGIAPGVKASQVTVFASNKRQGPAWELRW